MRSLVAGLLVALAGSAAAQTPDDPPAPRSDEKSLSTAMEWSLGVTTIGVAGLAATAAMTTSSAGARSAMFSFGGLGLLVGPSLGRMYAGTWFSGGEVVRAVGLTVIVMGEAIATSCLGTPHGTCNSATPRFDAGPIAAGGAVMLFGALFDLGAIPGDVARHNRELDLSLHPAPILTSRGTAPGLALSGRF
jgi:hypothetical protein